MTTARTARRLLTGGAIGLYGLNLVSAYKEWRVAKPPVTLQKYMMLRSLPMHTMSTISGYVSELPVPLFVRPFLYSSFARLYKVNMNECDKPLQEYPTFQSFFTRALKDGARPLSKVNIVSPCDGTVLASGEIDSDSIKIGSVKGINVDLITLLGNTEAERLLTRQRNRSWFSWFPWATNAHLYYAIVYLAPGDYHRFHSPCDLRHVKLSPTDGMKLPVNPGFLKFIPETLQLNSRLCITGCMPDGNYMAIVPVGALNVSSIDCFLDLKDGNHDAKVRKGDQLGQFRMGSTVVIVFSSFKEMRIAAASDRVKQGESLFI
mgnify:FL=1